jgi:hypothetical protein
VLDSHGDTRLAKGMRGAIEETLCRRRLDRYTTAMRGGMRDRVPLRPLVAEFYARYAGLTCQTARARFRSRDVYE